ncbi:putative pectinesterase [Medicago truncatula]|uniref:Pectinesterase n=1 Tax=Medicago truncatula TaxID=3880 RepID=A0A072UU49_MEDTR|nr:probable pectinesterase/pectinesterase inhibitor 33 [Medicago truncatula]KEH29375.1 pectinesterase/pectinesterase inhibitor [Medicago truncatula]RHN59819.1 putative pectinesterase [Medicago truncatula]
MTIIMGKILLTLLLLSSIFSIATSSKRRSRSSNNNIDWWCNQTPHPETCKYYTKQTHYYHNKSIKHKTKFREILIHLALERAVVMRNMAHNFGQNSWITQKKKSVSRDCLKLFDNTVFHLNRTFLDLHKKKSCSSFDAQTWLSTAYTNIETCRNGALELNIPKFIVPIMKVNMTQIISNGLFVNWEFVKRDGRVRYTNDVTEEGFPRWFSVRERKLLESSRAIKAHIIVAKDGSGHFKRVQDAINAAGRRRFKTRFVIRVKKGVYRENIVVGKMNDNIMLVGDGSRNTVITSNRNVQAGFTTYSSATAGIDGLHFIARDITFENTAGPRRGQAVALRSASDLSVFYRCSFKGYQDTLMVHAQRQFYRECYIYGTVDFIFGNAAVVFQNCMILVRRPLNGQANMITAQGRDDPFQNTGISIHNSQIRAAPDFKPVVGKFNTFLGRPWQRYSRVVVMKSFMDNLVSPMGWSPWGGTNFAQSTLFYGEYKNFGPGSSTRNRVRWPGYHVMKSPAQASPFTVATLLAGTTWLPATGVPFTSGI